ncbi:SRPBCC family protein [Ramlibacter sp. USB13]|uniref:SRPBCC family protein n=1 Tax=Ramlibacter cellulosilyticus TaxID=2764187 RepID=A0A923SE83_9BURK|nr:SRPBCC family protein [Ramlibacter cellulosilyticus]MBC5782682.1 SRPBCC family protein [Ramlibacter cellulosilyticus]
MLQKVVRSAIIDAPIGRVWEVLRDFNSHDQWHAVVDQSRIEHGEPSSRVGCVRSFTLKDGNRIREQLLGLSDSEYKSTYCILDATVPLKRYVATVTLKPVTDGDRTFWHWESSFEAPRGREQELRTMVAEGVYEAGFANLRAYLSQTTVRSSVLPAPAYAGAGSAGTQGFPSREARLARYGGPEELETVASAAPPPAPGQVRIRQSAIGINFLDIYLRRGWIPGMLPLPGVLGMEAAGTVIDVGTGVTHVLPGDRVAYLCPQPGAYCSVRTLPARHVVRLPSTVDDETAAAILLKGITADYLLHDLGRIRPGTRLLVHAAAGGVGSLLCAWAKRLRATVIGTVSSEEKARIARDQGCEHVVVARDHRFADAVQAFCGGADVIVDGLGAAAVDENLAAADRRGHWISLGQASGPLPPLDPDRLLAKSLTFSRPVVFDYVATQRELQERAERVWRALAAGALPAPRIERFALAAAGAAHQKLESRASTGSLVLLP